MQEGRPIRQMSVIFTERHLWCW